MTKLHASGFKTPAGCTEQEETVMKEQVEAVQRMQDYIQEHFKGDGYAG